MHRGYTTPLVIAIMAFAVVAFLFLIDTSINPDGSKKSVNIKVSNTNATELNDHSICPTNLKQCPDGSFVGRDGPNCEFTECPTNMNTNTATDPTAGWKTYTNTSEGYAFKYPPTWAVENHAVIGILITPPISDVPVQGQGISRQVYIKSYSDTSEIASVRNQTQVTINGVKAIQGTYSPSSYETVDTYLPQGNGQIKVTWAKTYQNNTFESILSTFTLTAPTAGWSTYTNTEYNFSIKYPESYTASELNTVGKKTPEQITFFQGKSLTTSTRSIAVYSLTKANTSSDTFSGEVVQWYDWAISGFPSDTVIGRLSENKRQETYGQNTFTVINYDPGSSWSGSPLYYLVSGETVYILADFYAIDNKPKNDPDIVQQMLSTLTLSD